MFQHRLGPLCVRSSERPQPGRTGDRAQGPGSAKRERSRYI